MNNIYLVGMPGSGKSTIASRLANKVGLCLVDADELIVTREGRTIAELFLEGEDTFRKAETEALREISKMDGVLVATGGGIVTREENISIMKSTGKVIFIDASPEFILGNSSLNGRPLLKDKNKIYDLYKSRITLYRKASDYTVENNGILSDVCNRLEEVVRKIGKNQK